MTAVMAKIGEDDEAQLSTTPFLNPLLEFKKRPGTTDRGKDYEHLFIANVILKLITCEDVEEFWLSSNDKKFGSFDDVVIEIKHHGKEDTEIFAVQLKQSSNKSLIDADFIKTKGNFSIPKYLEDFHQSLQSLGKSVRMVLFTNCPAKLGNKIQLSLHGQTVDVDVSKTPLNNLFSSKGSCHTFVANEHEGFFQNFVLYTNQANDRQMKRNLFVFFKTKFNSEASIVNEYMEFITEWSQNEGTKKKLTGTWMKEYLFLVLSSPFVRTMSFSRNCSVNERGKLLRDAIWKFHITKLSKENYDKLGNLWADISNHPYDMTNVNRLIKKYQLNLNAIKSSDDFNGEDKEISKLLWLLNRCPLLIEGCPQVYKAIEVCQQTNLIVLDLSEHFKLREENNKNTSDHKRPLFQNLSDLRSDGLIYERIVSTFTYSIESQREAVLEQLLSFSEDLEEMITTDKLVQMIDGPLHIGNQQEDLPPCHIYRNLSKILIDFQFLEKLPRNHMALVGNVDDTTKFKHQLSKAMIADIEKYCGDLFSIYISKDDISPHQFTSLCSKHPTLVLHHFRYFNDKSLEWIKSEDSDGQEDNAYFQKLQSYRLSEYNSEGISQSTFFDKNENYVNVICDNPGMGKTTLMKSLKRSSSSLSWFIVIYARNHAQFFQKNGANIDDFLEYIFKLLTRPDDLDKQVLRILIDKNRIEIIWDGLDEASDETQDAIFNIVGAISERGIRHWLTSRNNLKDQLEARFRVFSRSIKQFDEQEQESYIRDRLSISEDELFVTFSKIKANIEAYSNNDILGIPLQIYMLTELFLQNHDKYLKLLDKAFTVVDLYEHFVEEKFNIFYQEKSKVDLNNELNNARFRKEKREKMQHYKKLAYHLHFTGLFAKTVSIVWSFLGLGQHRDPFLDEIRIKGDEMGFLTKVTSREAMEFAHNSYGEYFAALYLYENDRRRVRDAAFISQDRYNNIRFFLDLMLARNSPALVAILYKNDSFIEQCTLEDLVSRDEIGRDPIEIACAWNKHYSLLKMEKDGIFTFDLNVSNNKFLKYENISKHFNRIVDSLDVTKRRVFVLLPFLIQFYDESIQDLCEECLPTILYYAIKLDSIFILNYIHASFSLMISTQNIDKTSLLSLTVSCSSYKLFQKYLDMSEYRIVLVHNLESFMSSDYEKIVSLLINFRDERGSMLIHHACEENNLKSIKLLVDNGTKVDVVGGNGLTPIHYACKHGHPEMIPWLLKNLQDVNIFDEDGIMPIHYACESGPVDVVKQLTSKGAKLYIPDQRGTPPIHYACVGNQKEILDFLVTQGISVNVRNVDGLLPLHYACKIQRMDIAKYLLNSGSEVDCLDKEGRAPMHYACIEGKYHIILLLLKHGSTFCVLDKDGLSPIHYLCQRGFFNILMRLIHEQVYITIPDAFGLTPLHYMCNSELSSATHLNIDQFMEKIGNENFNTLDITGRTPLHYACLSDRSSVVELLLKRGANVNARDARSRTPLHYACEKAATDVVDVLINAGADLNVVDAEGRLPLECFPN